MNFEFNRIFWRKLKKLAPPRLRGLRLYFDKSSELLWYIKQIHVWCFLSHVNLNFFGKFDLDVASFRTDLWNFFIDAIRAYYAHRVTEKSHWLHMHLSEECYKVQKVFFFCFITALESIAMMLGIRPQETFYHANFDEIFLALHEWDLKIWIKLRLQTYSF